MNLRPSCAVPKNKTKQTTPLPYFSRKYTYIIGYSRQHYLSINISG
jgi:hypothetical protein